MRRGSDRSLHRSEVACGRVLAHESFRARPVRRNRAEYASCRAGTRHLGLAAAPYTVRPLSSRGRVHGIAAALEPPQFVARLPWQADGLHAVATRRASAFEALESCKPSALEQPAEGSKHVL